MITDEFRVTGATENLGPRMLLKGLRCPWGTFVCGMRDWKRLSYAEDGSSFTSGSFYHDYLYPFDTTHAAVYRIENGALVADGPEDAVKVVALAWYDDELYAIGSRFIGTVSDRWVLVEYAYAIENGEDVSVGRDHVSLESMFPRKTEEGIDWYQPTTCELQDTLWKRSEAGVWEVVCSFPMMNQASVDADPDMWDAITTYYGIMFSFKPFSTAANTSGSATGMRSWWLWNGTKSILQGTANAVVASDDGTEIVAMRNLAEPSPNWTGVGEVFGLPTTHPVPENEAFVKWGKPFYWRGSVWTLMMDATENTETDQYGRLELGKLKLGYFDSAGSWQSIWEREIGGGAFQFSSFRAVATPSGICGFYGARLQLTSYNVATTGIGILWVYQPSVPEDGSSHEWVVTFDGRVIRSKRWMKRVYVAFDGCGESAIIYQTYDMTSKYPNWVGGTTSYELDGDPWTTSGWVARPRQYAISSSVVELCVHRIRLEYADGSEDHEPEVGRASIGWSRYPNWENEPEVELVEVQYSDGSKSHEPEVASVAVSYADGLGLNEPTVSRIRLQWESQMSYDREPIVSKLGLEWRDGTGSLSPEVGSLSIGYADGTGVVDAIVKRVRVGWNDGVSDPTGNEPLVHRTSVEWSWAKDLPEGWRILWVVHTSQKPFSALLVASLLGPTVDDQCKLYVRCDAEALAVDAWGTYQIGTVGNVVHLDVPGKVVRVGVAGPATLPLDTDFHFQFLR